MSQTNFVYRKNRLYVEKVDLTDITTKVGTPVFVYSKTQLYANLRRYITSFVPRKNLICYAMKANSNYTICKYLAHWGAGVDITSAGELYRALKAGFVPEKIVYAGVGKREDEIVYALKTGILMFNVESQPELRLISRLAVQLGKKAKIALRYNPEIDPHTHHYIATGKSGTKFGFKLPEILNVFDEARNLPAIEIAGIHCHIGSQITEVGPFLLAAKKVYQLYTTLTDRKISISYINLGGGLGIKYENETPPTPQDLAGKVLPIFRQFKGILIFEPGRYIVGNTGILVTRLLYRKQTGKKVFYIVDAGMNDLIRPTLYTAYHRVIPVTLPAGGKQQDSELVDIVGPICETGDWLGKQRVLPCSRSDDLLAIENAGAYGMTMSSQYNSRLRAAEVMVDGKSWCLVRKRERLSDLVRYETFNY